jgi:hypothetical protein
MASVLAVLALHPGRILEELATQCAPHDLVKLVLHELVSEFLVNLFFLLPDRALSA